MSTVVRTNSPLGSRPSRGGKTSKSYKTGECPIRRVCVLQDGQVSYKTDKCPATAGECPTRRLSVLQDGYVSYNGG